MIRSLWTAASGMIGQQFNIDTISNNLANVNTTGYKQNRTEFQDLIYQTIRRAGTPATEQTLAPVGLQVGHGVKVSASHKIFSDGAPRETHVKTDMAIQGEGFFRIVLPDGTYAYTRNGEFKIDANRQLVTANGYRLEPNIFIPRNAELRTLKITEEGEVSIIIGADEIPTNIGQAILYRFINPAGMNALGNNNFRETIASGTATAFQPGDPGAGVIRQGFLERSNVELVTELVNMITAQRAYEFSSKSIQTSDSMLSVAVNLKR